MRNPTHILKSFQPWILRSLFALIVVALLAPTSADAQISDRERLETYITRTAEVIEFARDVVVESRSARARRILEQAVMAHERSMEMFQNLQPREAFSLSQRARSGAQHAARLAREAASDTERLQRRMERLVEMRDQIGERVRDSGDERAMRFLREGEQQLRRARDLFQQGDAPLALQVLKGAEELLARAARIAFEGNGGQRLQNEFERTREFLEQVHARLSDDANQDARELLTSADQALQRSSDAMARGRTMQALNSLRLARRLGARAAASTHSGNLDRASVEQQLGRFDERFAGIREIVADAGNRAASQALERAQVHRDRAGQLLENGDPESAMRQIKAGFDLLTAARELVQ